MEIEGKRERERDHLLAAVKDIKLLQLINFPVKCFTPPIVAKQVKKYKNKCANSSTIIRDSSSIAKKHVPVWRAPSERYWQPRQRGTWSRRADTNVPLVHVTSPLRKALDWKENYVPGGLASVAVIVTWGKTKCHLSSWLYKCRGMSRQAREWNNIGCLLWHELSPSLLVHALLCQLASYEEFPCIGCRHIGRAEYTAFDVGQVLALWGPPVHFLITVFFFYTTLPTETHQICQIQTYTFAKLKRCILRKERLKEHVFFFTKQNENT